MTGQRPSFAIGTLTFSGFTFGGLTSSPFAFGTLLSINLALLGDNLFSRFALIDPFNCVFRIIFIWVFILVLGNRAFAFGTMLHSTDLMFLKSVMINPFTSIFRTTPRSIFRSKFINIFRMSFITIFRSVTSLTMLLVMHLPW